ncbi:MAG: hypothetical protein J0H69_16980 [Burkholderiales bacterium]|nr:hypothetical protein [Burkholderiales bacterium]
MVIMGAATEFKKGKKPGPGRPPGTPNKATVEFRATVQALLDENRGNVAIWLKQVAEGIPESGGVKAVAPAPEKALDLLAKLAEFAAPKLARTEHVGENGGAMKFEVSAPWLQQAIEQRNK